MNWLQPTTTKAFTIVELAMVIAVVSVFALFIFVAVERVDETSDADTLITQQSQIQSVIVQGAQRLGMPLWNIPARLVVTALPPNPRVKTTDAGGRQYGLEINRPGIKRTANLYSNPCGDVCVASISGFGSYVVKQSSRKCHLEPATATCGYIAN
jgi:hypothetical protein